MSDVLYASFGLVHRDFDLRNKNIDIVGLRKASPASGGLHAEEAYIVAYNIEGLKSGLYYYRPQDHKLNLIKSGLFSEEVKKFNRNQPFGDNLAFGVYVTARLDKYCWENTSTQELTVLCCLIWGMCHRHFY